MSLKGKKKYLPCLAIRKAFYSLYQNRHFHLCVYISLSVGTISTGLKELVTSWWVFPQHI